MSLSPNEVRNFLKTQRGNFSAPAWRQSGRGEALTEEERRIIREDYLHYRRTRSLNEQQVLQLNQRILRQKNIQKTNSLSQLAPERPPKHEKASVNSLGGRRGEEERAGPGDTLGEIPERKTGDFLTVKIHNQSLDHSLMSSRLPTEPPAPEPPKDELYHEEKLLVARLKITGLIAAYQLLNIFLLLWLSCYKETLQQKRFRVLDEMLLIAFLILLTFRLILLRMVGQASMGVACWYLASKLLCNAAAGFYIFFHFGMQLSIVSVYLWIFWAIFQKLVAFVKKQSVFVSCLNDLASLVCGATFIIIFCDIRDFRGLSLSLCLFLDMLLSLNLMGYFLRLKTFDYFRGAPLPLFYFRLDQALLRCRRENGQGFKIPREDRARILERLRLRRIY